jgi:type IV pilus assembly protein PilA
MTSHLKELGRGNRGFTLIELLVVVAILGILSSVVVLNIGSFLKSGAVEAANTEIHQVQTAVLAFMVSESLTTWTGEVGPDSESGSSGHPVDFLLNPGSLQATYTIEDGVITDAKLTEDSKWGELDFIDGSWRRS